MPSFGGKGLAPKAAQEHVSEVGVFLACSQLFLQNWWFFF
jgi:hypothetical protein